MPFQFFELFSAWDVFSDLRLGQELTNQEEERFLTLLSHSRSITFMYHHYVNVYILKSKGKMLNTCCLKKFPS